jgi:hypothetical protein
MSRPERKSNFRGKVGEDAERHQREGSEYGYLNLPKGIKMFKPVEGQYFIDIIPYVVTDEKHPDADAEKEIALPDMLWYKRPFKIHRNIGGGQGESVVCLSSIGKPCPICKARAEMTRNGADKKETDTLKPSLRNLYAVIPLGSKDFDENVHLWDMSNALFQDLLEQEIGYNKKYDVFPDLEEGYTLKVRFEEDSYMKNKFYEAKRIDFEDREQPYKESILDEVIDLDNVLKILSYEELEKKFLEIDDDDDAKDRKDNKTDKTRCSHKDESNDRRSERNTRLPEKEEEKSSSRREERSTSRRDDKRSSRQTEKESEPEFTWQDLQAMSEERLIRIIDSKDLDINVDDYKDDIDGLTEAVATALGVEIPEPPKKSSGKEKDNVCVACQGTGKNSRGRTCPICNGTGMKPEEKEERQERTSTRGSRNDKDDEPVRQTRIVSRNQPKEVASGGRSKSDKECPAGLVFGKDNGTDVACDTCDLYDDCIEAKVKRR